MSTISEIQPQEAYARARSAAGDVIVDVRTNEEWQGGHAPGALHFVLDTLAQHWDELRGYENVYFVCRSGGRSEIAAVQAQAAGLSNVHNVVGGMKRWKKEGLPVEA